MTESSGWESSVFAASWTQSTEARNTMLAPATERMFVEARVVPGACVLDVGTGTGDTALLAAERVGPSGRVVATDASAAMVLATTAAVKARGPTNVAVRPMNVANVDLPSNSFDAIIARNVLMFVPLPRAVVGLHRVLRPGGRLAAVVWSALANNPFHRIVLDAARTRGGWADSPPEMARAFALGDANVYRRTLEGAGYCDVAVHAVPSVRRFASVADAVSAIRASPIQSEPIARLAGPRQGEAWTEIENGLRAFQRAGSCEIPLESLVVVGQKERRAQT
jgi:ubiquinone/menaquinone biosynthesis C-methylase UbiE